MDSAGIILRNKEGKFLLQHRDDKEEVACRNMWGLFGGAIDEGETPEETVVREIMEELCFDISGKIRFIEKINIPGIANVYIYEYLGTVEIDELEQKEGQGMRFFSVEEVGKENVVLSIKKFIESGKVL
jgi:8-oxo-dGTP diphosphatase